MYFLRSYHKLHIIFGMIVIAGVLASSSLPVEARSQRSKSAGRGKSRSKVSHHAKPGRSRGQDSPLPLEAYQAPPAYPDSIEVIEYGSSAPILSRLLNIPNTNLSSANLDSTDPPDSPKHMNLKMDSSRVAEIQQALASRGFYQGEPSGVYDEPTVDAMRRFQLKENIPVTGYPTAHALRRLGLAKW